MSNPRNWLAKGFAQATKPREKLTAWEWCEKYVVVDRSSSIGGGMKWRLDNSPWVKPLFDAFEDPEVETIVCRCATQSSKTQTVLCLLAYIIGVDPAPTMWIANAKDDLQQTVRDRISPTLKACEPVAAQLLSESVMEFSFTTMPLYFVGGGSKGKVKSKPIRNLLLDEVEEIPAANVYQALERTKAQYRKKRLLISTPHMADGIMETMFKQGNQLTLNVTCPHCSKPTPLLFDQIKWDTNDETRPGGTYDWNKLEATVRWECPACKGVVRDGPYERRGLSKSSHYVALNPNASRKIVSVTWPSIIAPWVRWSDIVTKFINARHAAKGGDREPLKSFINDDCGHPWEDRLGVVEDFGFLEARKRDYDYGEAWSEETIRFMAADVQEKGGEHYWYAIRAFGKFAASRLIAYGRCNSLAELEEVRESYKVLPQNACIDSGWRASRIYAFCCAKGWKAFKGEPQAEHFVRRVPVHGAPGKFRVARMMWEKTYVDPLMGKPGAGRRTIPLFRHVGNAVKDDLAEYTMGLVGDFTIPACVGRDYMKQNSAERREEHIDPKGNITRRWRRVDRDNHLGDCEQIIHVAAHASKTLGR